jgi:hypothetical protein
VRKSRPKIVRGLFVVGAVLLVGGAAQAAGEFKARLVGFDNLRPSTVQSASAGAHLYTLREFDPLVPAKYANPSANAEDDLVVAIYGAGGPGAFGAGQIIRLAGARAVPGTSVIPQSLPVIFRNDDPFTHHISGPEIPPDGHDLKPGESFQIQPKNRGLFVYTDSIFPSVKAWVVVDDGVIADRAPGLDGSIKIPLEGNTYTFKVFFEGQQKGVLNEFKVSDKGSTDGKDIQVGPAAPAGSGK